MSGHGREPTAWQRLASLIDLATPMAMRAAATLGVADALAFGPVPAAELARRTGTDPEALTRVLRVLTAHGVFEEVRDRAGSDGAGSDGAGSDGAGRDGAGAEPAFALNPLAELLRSDHPSEMRVQLDMDGFGGRMDLAFTGIMHTLRTGGPCFESVFGTPFWRYLSEDPAMGASFDHMMAGPEYINDAVDGYNWPAGAHFVDVGGGNGSLLAGILSVRPDARGTVLDLPDTAERARIVLAESGLSDRSSAIGGSFFDAIPAEQIGAARGAGGAGESEARAGGTSAAGAEGTSAAGAEGPAVYILSNILHDWPDSDAAAILQRCADAVHAGGEGARLLIVEGLSERNSARHGEADGGPIGNGSAGPRGDYGDGSGAHGHGAGHEHSGGHTHAVGVDFAEMNLRMMALVGGRHRTADDYRAMAATAGLGSTRVHSTALGQAIIDCRAGSPARRSAGRTGREDSG